MKMSLIALMILLPVISWAQPNSKLKINGPLSTTQDRQLAEPYESLACSVEYPKHTISLFGVTRDAMHFRYDLRFRLENINSCKLLLQSTNGNFAIVSRDVQLKDVQVLNGEVFNTTQYVLVDLRSNNVHMLLRTRVLNLPMSGVSCTNCLQQPATQTTVTIESISTVFDDNGIEKFAFQVYTDVKPWEDNSVRYDVWVNFCGYEESHRSPQFPLSHKEFVEANDKNCPAYRDSF